MTNLEKLTRLMIEAIHGKPWEEAMKCEEVIIRPGSGKVLVCDDWIIEAYNQKEEIKEARPLTIGRVIAALFKKNKYSFLKICDKSGIRFEMNQKILNILYHNWQLTDSNGRELTLADQSKETIDQLLSIFQPSK